MNDRVSPEDDGDEDGDESCVAEDEDLGPYDDGDEDDEDKGKSKGLLHCCWIHGPAEEDDDGDGK